LALIPEWILAALHTNHLPLGRVRDLSRDPQFLRIQLLSRTWPPKTRCPPVPGHAIAMGLRRGPVIVPRPLRVPAMEQGSQAQVHGPDDGNLSASPRLLDGSSAVSSVAAQGATGSGTPAAGSGVETGSDLRIVPGSVVAG
jgi:hypothetical protein